MTSFQIFTWAAEHGNQSGPG